MKTNLKNRTPYILLLYFFSSIFLLCSQTPTNQVGNSTQTGNGMIVGVIFNKDGSFAKSAKVSLRKRSSLADTSGTMLKKIVAIDTATTITNDSGKFVIDSIDTGTYVILSTDGSNNLALNDTVTVKSKDSTITVPNDTLKPAGAIKGIIKLSEGGDPRKVFVLTFGVDRFAKVNADGSFKISSLAEGKYDLRFISGLDNYGVLDTVNIPVKSQDTTNLDTITMPYTGIPVPKNLKIIYDSLSQIATIKWSKCDSTAVSGYKLYRKKDDSLFILISNSIKKDTVFFDTNLIQNSKYIYRIAAVNINDQEGLLSIPDTLIAKSAFKTSLELSLDSIQPQTKPFRYAVAGDGSLFMTIDEQHICKLDSNGKVIGRFGDGKFVQLFDIILDDKDNVFALDATFDSSKIVKYSKSGTYMSEWKIRNRCAYSMGIDSKMNIYVETADSQFTRHVEIYDTAGIFIRMLNIGQDGMESISPSGDIYTRNSITNSYSVYKNGNVLTSTFTALFQGEPVSQLNSIDSMGNTFFEWYMTGSRETNGIYVFNSNHQMFARWTPALAINQYFIVKNNTCYVLSTGIPLKLLIYRLDF